jgi:hypothetical protein
MDIINTNLNVQKISDPYDIWIIDNFLKEHTLKGIKDAWPSYENDAWYVGHPEIDGKKNILEQGMLGISKVGEMPEFISNVMSYIHTKEFTERISNLLNLQNLFPDEHMRWSGMRTMLPNSFQLIHSDARKSPNSGMRKEVTCLLYLNENYNKENDGGCLEVWSDDMSTCMHEIEPISNRFVAFLNSDTSYHGVPTVKSERKLITFSILANDSSTDRYKALFVARPTDSVEVGIEGVKRSQIKDIKK